jgi:hypothetical protein
MVGVLRNVLPTATAAVDFKMTRTATASSWHEFGDTDAIGITLGTLGEFQAVAALGQTTDCRMWLGMAQDGGMSPPPLQKT